MYKTALSVRRAAEHLSFAGDGRADDTSVLPSFMPAPQVGTPLDGPLPRKSPTDRAESPEAPGQQRLWGPDS